MHYHVYVVPEFCFVFSEREKDREMYVCLFLVVLSKKKHKFNLVFYHILLVFIPLFLVGPCVSGTSLTSHSTPRDKPAARVAKH